MSSLAEPMPDTSTLLRTRLPLRGPGGDVSYDAGPKCVRGGLRPNKQSERRLCFLDSRAGELSSYDVREVAHLGQLEKKGIFKDEPV